MGALLELIEVERDRVQNLRTRFTIAKAFQDELDARSHGRLLEFANTTIHQMVSDHRYGLVARVAGWVQTATGTRGFLDQIAAGDFAQLRSRIDPDRSIPVIGELAERFRGRSQAVAEGADPSVVDFESLRDELRTKAAEVTANADDVRKYFETAASALTPVALERIEDVIVAAEELLNELARCAGEAEYGFSHHLAHPDAATAARDLVDLELIGTIDQLVVATGVNQRLGASGMWWWQYREDLWTRIQQAAQDYPAEPMNAIAVVRAARSRPRPLTTPQIERLVARYRLEYARYEAAARGVESKLRSMLDAARVKALISSRAKDPKSLNKKLEKKGKIEQKRKYEFAELEADLGAVVTDLAGVRVILYDDQEGEQVAVLIKQAWPECTDEAHAGPYQARHLTVVVAEQESRSIAGARCEIQLTSLASHAFNELEHDIGYKDQDVPPGEHVRGKLEALAQNAASLRIAIGELLAAREDELTVGKTALATGTDLGAVLDRALSRRVSGDLDALAYLWQGLEKELLTKHLVERQAPSLLSHGALLAASSDDATAIAFALVATSPGEARDIARDYPNQDSTLIRAILRPSISESS
jgi:ppGpp synthetase/RelA/SpoT-type nucleotidyltranferase